MSAADFIDRMSALCASVGFDLKSVSGSLLARMRLLDERSETVADAERTIERAWQVFRSSKTNSSENSS